MFHQGVLTDTCINLHDPVFFYCSKKKVLKKTECEWEKHSRVLFSSEAVIFHESIIFLQFAFYVRGLSLLEGKLDGKWKKSKWTGKKKAELLTVVFVYYTLIRTLPQNDAEAFRSWMKMCG